MWKAPSRTRTPAATLLGSWRMPRSAAKAASAWAPSAQRTASPATTGPSAAVMASAPRSGSTASAVWPARSRAISAGTCSAERPGLLARSPRRRGERASKPGLSAEQVPALIARDRAGHTADAVLPDLGADAITAALGPVVAGDAVLCADGAQADAAFAAERGIRHEPSNVAAGVRVRDGAFHIQNVNAYHGRLKGWMGRFNGVATRYLANYLGWRRTLERAAEPSASRTWLLAAARSTATANAN